MPPFNNSLSRHTLDMRPPYKHLLLLLTLLISVGFKSVLAAEPQSGQNSDQGFERGLQAYQAKDYELARQTFKPLAEAGHIEQRWAEKISE